MINKNKYKKLLGQNLTLMHFFKNFFIKIFQRKIKTNNIKFFQY